MLNTAITLTRAYKPMHTSRNDAARDWAQGKDFKIVGGPYCSIRDKDMLIKDYGNIMILIANDEPLVI